MTLLQVTDDRTKVKWNVRIVEVGEHYGLNNAVLNEYNEPLIEFYDTRHMFTALGQFVSRYNLSTFKKVDSGLYLDTGTPSWSITEKTVKEIQNSLK